MPAGVGDWRAAVALARDRVPVAFVVRVRIAAVAVARHEGIADEVVARQDVRVEVGMVGDAGVDDRDHHARAGGLVPRRLHVDARRGGAEAPLLGEAGVVRRQHGVHALVDFHVFHVRIGGQLAHQRFGFDAVQLAVGAHDLGAAGGEPTQLLQAQRATAALGDTGAGRLGQRALQLRRAGAFGTAVAVLHNEAVVATRFFHLQATHVDAPGHGGQCVQRRQHGRRQAQQADTRTTLCKSRHQTLPQSCRKPKNGKSPVEGAGAGTGGGGRAVAFDRVRTVQCTAHDDASGLRQRESAMKDTLHAITLQT